MINEFVGYVPFNLTMFSLFRDFHKVNIKIGHFRIFKFDVLVVRYRIIPNIIKLIPLTACSTEVDSRWKLEV